MTYDIGNPSPGLGHAQRTEEYILLTFNAYTSGNGSFPKVYAHYEQDLAFFWKKCCSYRCQWCPLSHPRLYRTLQCNQNTRICELLL